tara:strand:+ start:617 stop:841 length:225 start_codon:yes stop_codon:yes gene_type:complete
MSKAPWCIDGGLKPGDLVKLTAYPSQYEKIGDMGIIVKDTTVPRQAHQIVLVRFTNGRSAQKAHFCLEVISESR